MLECISTYHIYLNQQHSQSECVSKLLQTVVDVVRVEVVIPQTLCRAKNTQNKTNIKAKFEQRKQVSFKCLFLSHSLRSTEAHLRKRAQVVCPKT